MADSPRFVPRNQVLRARPPGSPGYTLPTCLSWPSHPHWGERPKAYVTLSEGAAATPEEIIAFCRDRLAHYKCPDAVEFGPLPKTSTGKIQKFVLRQREWEGQDKQVGSV